MGHSHLFFIYFHFFYSNLQLLDNIVPMLGFEPWISGVGSDWVTTSALVLVVVLANKCYSLVLHVWIGMQVAAKSVLARPDGGLLK